MASTAKATASSIDTAEPPLATKELRQALRAYLKTPISNSDGITIGSCVYGVYAFFDYDKEPIYVGQTRESLGTRIRRHLTNQRTDAVAMSVLDPLEVCMIRVWPLPQYQKIAKNDPERKAAGTYLDGLEATVFSKLVGASKFKAVLNEKVPASSLRVVMPKDYFCNIVAESVKTIYGHPDIRLARRASTIARLAQVICEREVQPGLRRTLKIQAERLLGLAEARFKPFAVEAKVDDKNPSSGEN